VTGLRYLSVCSGIEAASVAWEPLGWRPWALSEIEPFPSAVLAHRFPSVPNLGDMTRFREWPDADVDILVGGTPCQSFSVAGLRKGLDDPRGNLALVYLALADRYRPRWIVWENVPGVLSSNGGRDFGAFLGGLGQLGYGFAYRVLDAQFVRVGSHPRAVPQRRRRVFVVGHLGDWRRAAAVLFDAASLCGDSPPRREAGQVAPTIPARSLGGGGLGTDFDCDGGLIAGLELGNQGSGGNVGWFPPSAPCRTLDTGHPPGIVHASTGDVPHCLNAGGMGRQDYETETMVAVAHALRGEGFDLSTQQEPKWAEDVAPTLALPSKSGGGQPTAVAFQQNSRSEVRMIGGDGAVVGALASEPGMQQQNFVAQPIAFSSKDHGGDASFDLSPTLRAGGHAGSHAKAGVPPVEVWPINTQIAMRHEALGEGTGFGIGEPDDPSFTLQAAHSHGIATFSAVRRLTPRECERLQGFPDGWTKVPYRGRPAEECSDGPRYKALGNSFAVNVISWIGERIQMVENLGDA